ncbi:ATP synthase subunit I [Celeribacter neptunius]|uniref:N-ATPase, AtpR subunit n=1 Tax=Celeribacter neptunius TaxID=588602 RepID=A0A1I3NU68_9RHOB|nr:ATP synthase subunit I [Celeribacter neptunius]SFJ12791.1 N-ATPase, AtpR subunit [Celeribacter neptunius]
MTHSMTDTILIPLLGLLLGLALGFVHFSTLKRVTALYLGGGRVIWAVALQIIRLVLLALVMVFLARQGALPLLAGALGVLIARFVVLRGAKATGERGQG